MRHGDVKAGKVFPRIQRKGFQFLFWNQHRDVLRIESERFQGGIVHDRGKRVGDRTADHCVYFFLQHGKYRFRIRFSNRDLPFILA